MNAPQGDRERPRGRHEAGAGWLPRQAGMNCIKIGLPGKLILRKRKGLREVIFSSPRIDFPGRPFLIQFPPGGRAARALAGHGHGHLSAGGADLHDAGRPGAVAGHAQPAVAPHRQPHRQEGGCGCLVQASPLTVTVLLGH